MKDAAGKNDTRKFYKITAYKWKQFKPGGCGVRDREDTMFTDPEGILRSFKRHPEGVFEEELHRTSEYLKRGTRG